MVKLLYQLTFTGAKLENIETSKNVNEIKARKEEDLSRCLVSRSLQGSRIVMSLTMCGHK